MKNNNIKIYSKSYITNFKFCVLLLTLLFLVCPNILYPQTPTLYGPPGSRTIDLYVNEKDPSIIFTSNYDGGVFRTEGDKTSIFETYMGNFQNQSIYYSNNSKKTFLYSSSYFINSTEYKLNWNLIYNDKNYYPRTALKHFIVNPNDENVMYMHRHGKEIWRSNDCGDSWFLLYTFDNDIGRMAIAPTG